MAQMHSQSIKRSKIFAGGLQRLPHPSWFHKLVVHRRVHIRILIFTLKRNNFSHKTGIQDWAHLKMENHHQNIDI